MLVRLGDGAGTGSTHEGPSSVIPAAPSKPTSFLAVTPLSGAAACRMLSSTHWTEMRRRLGLDMVVCSRATSIPEPSTPEEVTLTITASRHY